MKKMINQAPIVRYRASVCEIFFSDFRKKTFSAESRANPDPSTICIRVVQDLGRAEELFKQRA
jgi:hypothetical protein